MFKGIKKYIIGYYRYGKAIDGMNPYVFLIDGLWCWLRYGCVFNQFTEGGFYKYRAFHRKKILTYRNWQKIVALNAIDDIHYFKNKVDFNTFFKAFVGRDWLYSKSMTMQEFTAFTQKHSRAIVKPIDDWEGNGISMIKITPPKTKFKSFLMSLNRRKY